MVKLTTKIQNTSEMEKNKNGHFQRLRQNRFNCLNFPIEYNVVFDARNINNSIQLQRNKINQLRTFACRRATQNKTDHYSPYMVSIGK